MADCSSLSSLECKYNQKRLLLAYTELKFKLKTPQKFYIKSFICVMQNGDGYFEQYIQVP